MPDSAQSVQPRTIVIPRQLEGYFYERLSTSFADRSDVEVVVDRRTGERRRPRWVSGSGPFTERRHGDRRAGDVVWSLPDMPYAAS